MNLTRAAQLTVFLIGIVFILIVGKNLIIPLVLAALIWFLIKEIRKIAQRIPFLGKRFPRWLLNLFSVSLLYFIFGAIIHMLVNNINQLSENIPLYEENLKGLSTKINELTGLEISQMWTNFVGEFNFPELLSEVLQSLSELLGNAVMIGLYLLFMLLEESLFRAKLLSVYRSEEKKKEIEHTFSQIGDSISNYIALKTLVSIITGLLSYIVLAIAGIDSPLFWAFLIFILNFIPTIGSLVATLFPAAMALLQFGDFNMALIILAAVGSIQLIVGNIIEPKVMGNSLNVSSLVVILALSFWGAIWGITGMILSVPITVILIILLGQFESTKTIAIFLSEKGKID